MNLDEFFKSAETALGTLNADQRAGFRALLKEAESRNTQINDLAYILATTWWETAHRMEPVREAFFISKNFNTAEKWRKNKLWYYPYYGRGYVQLTHKGNYKFAGQKLGVDFVNDPDKVLEVKYALKILFDGMEAGWFTGKNLDDYIDDLDENDNADLAEYIKARKIINGTDKATTIAGIALAMEKALKAGGHSKLGTPTFSASVPFVADKPKDAFAAHIAKLGLKHFKPYEFLVKGGAHSNPSSPAHGLNTDPPPAVWSGIDDTARVLDELREKLGRPIVTLSVYRSPAYNKAIGGAADSQHKAFTAVDFNVLGSPVGPLQWASALRDIRSTGFFKGGIGTYGSFVHVDTRGVNKDWVG